ncbi:Sporulation related domain-containing protein [Amphibacillus marinus]|uniref:Sporulation related domain-containing protein n=1 Tax=Amphibacillus marinus TaxID=872970 RepID=A0A1H8TSY1_9BACI|nr:SPOR domain-containing protein [Amphibacillus marinus]SEO93538.1 Sporulation related domain-containing protein [Amphibacillus marinus]
MEEKKKLTYKLEHNQYGTVHDEPLKEEAAGLSDLEPFHYNSSSSNKKTLNHTFIKRIAFTAAAAILVSLGIGYIFMSILGDGSGEAPLNDQITNFPVEANQSTTNEEGADTNGEGVELIGLTGFVIQAGVFQDFSQAESYQQELASLGHDGVLWSTEEGYRLFLGVYSSNEGAKDASAAMVEQEIDVFVRDWQTLNQTIPGTSADQQLLQAFTELWRAALSDDAQLEQGWQEWQEFDDSQLTSAVQSFYQTSSQIEMTASGQQRAANLLQLWQSYTELGK